MDEDNHVTESDAYATAIALLARREHSVRELTVKLGARGVSAAMAAVVIARLIAERLQSDERFAEVYLRQRSAKGYGPIRIALELRERGIDDALVSAELRRVADEGEIDWFVCALMAYSKKYGVRPIADIKERAKRMRFLQYRGFSHEQIAAAIERE
jgi:regulatory protein